ncbi:MAG: hypothetical protein ACREB3_00405 [Burkholderiales bacterium]
MTDCALRNWYTLNDALMKCVDETTLQTWLQEERAGKCRKTFVRRIYSRLVRVRADREVRELYQP